MKINADSNSTACIWQSRHYEKKKGSILSHLDNRTLEAAIVDAKEGGPTLRGYLPKRLIKEMNVDQEKKNELAALRGRLQSLPQVNWLLE